MKGLQDQNENGSRFNATRRWWKRMFTIMSSMMSLKRNLIYLTLQLIWSECLSLTKKKKKEKKNQKVLVDIEFFLRSRAVPKAVNWAILFPTLYTLEVNILDEMLKTKSSQLFLEEHVIREWKATALTSLILQLGYSKIPIMPRLGQIFLKSQFERYSLKSLANECYDTYHLIMRRKQTSKAFC